MKDNVRDFKVYQGNGKSPSAFIPRFIRNVRTPHSERYSIIGGEDFGLIGTLDMHINDEIQATLVIVPDIDQETLELLIGLIKMELVVPLELDVESFNIYKGVSDCITLDEDYFSHHNCDGDCDHCTRQDCDEDDDDEDED
ncbi:MAG TPA: hypothetical protein VFC58_05780 [Desulfosporosinus sp.]|nr:hypothetical protein [Desulfosporosinus sp.]